MCLSKKKKAIAKLFKRIDSNKIYLLKKMLL